MIKTWLSVLAISLAGCTTAVPLTAKFPEPPKESGATNGCIELKKLSDGPTLSDVSRTINDNYNSYHECAIKVDTWNIWYQRQKEIFEKATKK